MALNSVSLEGRLTKDVELRYTAGQNQTAVCTFTLAVDRDRKPENGQTADFIRIVVFGKQAENCDRFLSKGRQCTVLGRIQTGNYKDRDGKTVYTTDVVAERVYFGAKSNNQNSEGYNNGSHNDGGYNTRGYDDGGYDQGSYNDMPEGFSDNFTDDDIPF